MYILDIVKYRALLWECSPCIDYPLSKNLFYLSCFVQSATRVFHSIVGLQFKRSHEFFTFDFQVARDRNVGIRGEFENFACVNKL